MVRPTDGGWRGNIYVPGKSSSQRQFLGVRDRCIDSHADDGSGRSALFDTRAGGGSEEGHELARRVIHRSIERLYLRSKERFVYRRGRYYTNKLNFMRWTQAWAFYAFSLYGADAERCGRDT